MPPTEHVEGFWGKPTATIDWCEKNYEVNYYVAELCRIYIHIIQETMEHWIFQCFQCVCCNGHRLAITGNTVTNLLIILPGLWGIREISKNGYKKRFFIFYFLICSVGVGSWLFHMTLLYSCQLLDELPMVYFVLFHCYYLMEVPNTASKNFFSNKPLFFFLFAFSVFFTLSYLLWPQPLFHQFAFVGLVIFNWLQQGRIVSWKQCKICKRLLIVAIALAFIAMFLWDVDVIFCSTLEDIRRSSYPGLGPLTQLHGWWHGIIGYSFHLQVVFAIHTWYDFHKEEKEEKRKLDVVYAGLSLRWR